MKHIVVLMGTIILISCQRDQLKYDWDPYLESFKDKGIRCLISTHYLDTLDTHADSLIDSIQFNRAGYITEKKMMGSKTRMAYDSLGRLIHILSEGDTYSNIFYTYELQDSVMFRYGFQIKHLGWVFNNEDVDSSTKSVMKYNFNNEGQIAAQQDDSQKMILHFSYQQNRLKKKELFSNGRLYIRWEYSYDNDRINKIVENDVIGRVLTVAYFSSAGLLIRTERSHNNSESIIQETTHRYIYY